MTGMIFKWSLWKQTKTFCEKQMTKAWMVGGNCDSCCPQCKQWESHGNVIKTEPQEDESVNRSCSNCGYSWRAIFTPAGFLIVESEK
ncbi:MAG: hypothetical protein GY707_03865 [Desulfobacteraceae bacterium]|nr:hypothetical protein [Desulfobacteraceae bacterium]